MRLKDYLFIIKKRLSTGIKLTILSFIITVIGFSFLEVAIAIPRVVTRAYRDLDRLLPSGLEHAGYINAMPELGDDGEFRLDVYSKCIEELNETEGIISAGVLYECYLDLNLTYDGVSYRDKMLEISNSNGKYANESEIDIPMYREMMETNIEGVKMDRYSLGIADFKLYKGDYNLEKYFEDGECVLYLGYNFRDVPLGAGMTVPMVGGKTGYFRVAGILEKGSEMIDPDTLHSYTIDTCYGMDLDNMVVLIDKDCNTGMEGWLVLYDESLAYEELCKTCTDIGKNNGVIIKTSSLRGKVEEQLTDFDFLLSFVELVYPIAFFVSLMIVLTVQLLVAIIRNDEIGVWMSNGMLRKDTFKIFLLENILKLGPAAIVGGMFSGIYLGNKAGLGSAQTQRVFFDMYIFAPLCAVIVAIVLAVLLTLISFFYINRRSLTDVIKNTME